MASNPFSKKKDNARRRVRPGSEGRPEFSYYSGSSPAAKTEKVVRGRKSSSHTRLNYKQLRKIPSLIALLAILTSVVYSTTLSPAPTVLFAGPPSPYKSLSEYGATAEQILSSSVWSRSKLTINTKKVETVILDAFPELDAVRVALPIIGRRPTVTLHARQPALILTTKTNVLILDQAGRAVIESRGINTSTRDSLLTLKDESGLELKVGDQALPIETLNFIQGAKQQLEHKKLKISRLILPAIPNELDIYIKGLGYYIKADVSGDARLQMGAFLAVKRKLGGLPPHSYMDVRVEEKVYYK